MVYRMLVHLKEGSLKNSRNKGAKRSPAMERPQGRSLLYTCRFDYIAMKVSCMTQWPHWPTEPVIDDAYEQSGLHRSRTVLGLLPSSRSRRCRVLCDGLRGLLVLEGRNEGL